MLEITSMCHNFFSYLPLDLQHRIQLIQDFEMPSVSNSVQITADSQFILATGTYKPRVRCFEVTQLSMKFERCFDSEGTALTISQ